MLSLPVIRTEGEFKRTSCDCELCSCFCKVMPGYLVPSDLDRLIPPNVDPLEWSRDHLRASKGMQGVLIHPNGEVESVSIPSLVPVKQPNGHCHWLLPDGKCGVHSASPFGCAFLDQHMSNEEAEGRNTYGRTARAQAFEENGLYATIWHALKAEGLVGGGEYDQAQALVQKVRQQMCRRMARRQRNAERKQHRQEKKQRRLRKR